MNADFTIKINNLSYFIQCDSSKGPVDESALEWFPFNENSTESQLIHINHTGNGPIADSHR